MRGSEFCLSVLAVLVAEGLMVRAFPNGPPTSTCESMLPSHTVAAQNSPPPYVFSSSVSCFTPGQRLTLTLSDPTLSTEFDGLFVQARQNLGPVQSYGFFDTNNNIHLKTINCFGGSSVTKKKVASGLQDTVIVFKATVVRSYSVFWVGIQYELPQCQLSGGNATSTMRTGQPTLSTSTQTYQSNSTSKQPGQPNCTDGNAAFCVYIRTQKRVCQYEYVKRFCCASCSTSSTGPTGPTRPTGSTGYRKFHNSDDQDKNSRDNSNSRDRY